MYIYVWAYVNKMSSENVNIQLQLISIYKKHMRARICIYIHLL